MPEHSAQNRGFIKLVKVAVGVLVGRSVSPPAARESLADYMFDSLRLAYSWGVTYPLVDNVLDSRETTPRVRDELNAAVAEAFGGPPAAAPPGVAPATDVLAEIRARLAEAVSLVPPDRLPRARSVLALLHEAHRRDAGRRLASTDAAAAAGLWPVVLADTALKAALVRLATMCLCGIDPDEAAVGTSLSRGLFNQLGDDLWDIYEDADDDRVTPFTLYLRYPDLPDPFVLYLDYAQMLAEGMSRRRATAVFYGVCESLRDVLSTLAPATDRLGVARRISAALGATAALAPEEVRQLRDVPHVDFDAILFRFEDLLYRLIPT
jgi:hypothetical protein